MCAVCTHPSRDEDMIDSGLYHTVRTDPSRIVTIVHWQGGSNTELVILTEGAK